MAFALSILALIATFYQLYLQRVHNEKSLQPLVQIDLGDHNQLIYVRVQNNGLGPFIIENISFMKDGGTYDSIRKCLSINPKSYHNIAVTGEVKKVILPNSFLDIFSVRLKESDNEDYVAKIKQELSLLNVKVEGRDIYKNKIIAKRDLNWFVKYHDL